MKPSLITIFLLMLLFAPQANAFVLIYSWDYNGDGVNSYVMGIHGNDEDDAINRESNKSYAHTIKYQSSMAINPKVKIELTCDGLNTGYYAWTGHTAYTKQRKPQAGVCGVKSVDAAVKAVYKSCVRKDCFIPGTNNHLAITIRQDDTDFGAFCEYNNNVLEVNRYNSACPKSLNSTGH